MTQKAGVRRSGVVAALLAGVLGLLPGLSSAAEVNGVFTEAATKDLGTVTGIKALEGVKTRGWISTYYNFRIGNHENQKNIPGRTFDIRDQSFTTELVELEIEKVPQPGAAGFKVDLAAGDTMDQIFTGVTGVHGANTLTPTDRNFQHATISYIADIGKGLRFDAGKMVTGIGGEATEAIKNSHFSHSYFFTYAIPFQHAGVRASYPLHDRVSVELNVYNGWNTTRDNDKAKSVHPSVSWNVGPLSGTLNYLYGQESDTVTTAIGSRSTRRQLFDTQVFYSQDKLNLGANFDYGDQKGVPVTGEGTKAVKWYGWAFYARYKVTDKLEPALRWETYVDPNNFTLVQTAGPGGTVATRINSLTATLNYKCTDNLLVRPEFRWDKANRRTGFFTDSRGQAVSGLSTLGLNAIYHF